MSAGPRCGLLALALLAGACGGRPTPPSAPVVGDPPPRTAAEASSLRRLLLGLAETHLCERLRGHLVALPDEDAPVGPAGGVAPAVGRLRIERCDALRRGDALSVRLEGTGFTHVARSAPGPMGSRFAVRGYLRFEAMVDLVGELDVAFAEEAGVVSLWLTPREGVQATIRPTGTVPVEPEGGWSRFLGAVGGAFGASPEERARPMIEEEGSARMRDTLGVGFTFTADVCRGQLDSVVGALGNGEVPERPYPPDEAVWLENQRVRLHPGGLDVAGPFEAEGAPVRLDLDLEEGEGVVLRVACAEEAERALAAFVAGEAAPEIGTLAEATLRAGGDTFLEVDTRRCPAVLLATPLGEGDVLFRYRARERDARAEPLVRCE